MTFHFKDGHVEEHRVDCRPHPPKRWSLAVRDETSSSRFRRIVFDLVETELVGGRSEFAYEEAYTHLSESEV